MNSQIDDKRTRLHQSIRARQIQSKLKTLRDAYIEQQRTTSLQLAHSINQKYADPINCQQSSNRKTTDSNKYLIGRLLGSDDSWEVEVGPIRHLRSETVKRIWQIVLEHSSEVCLDEANMQVLLTSAKEDIKALRNIQNFADKTARISQRLNRIIWTLLNECSKCPQISVQVVKQISSLCISIFMECENRKNINPRPCLPDTSLCILLLGNICVNEEHVAAILSLVKLNKLITMLDDIMEPKYYEDLSFMLCNILYYYPDPHGRGLQQLDEFIEENEENSSEISQANLLEIKQQQFELLQVLWSLYNKLAEDMLITASSSIRKNDVCYYQTPSKVASKQKNYTSLSKKKVKNDYALLSVEQKEKTIWLIDNKYRQVKLSNIYSHDLMECIYKIKQILAQLKEREVTLIEYLESKLGKTEVISQIFQACSKLEEEVSTKEKYTAVLIVRILHYQSQDSSRKSTIYSFNFGNEREKISFMSIFLRDIFRYFQSPTPRKHHNKAALELQQYIMSCKCEQLLKYINKQILTENAYCQEEEASYNKYLNSNVDDDIIDSLWEVYGYMIKYMSRNRESKNIHQVSYGNLCDREMETLQNRLVSIHSNESYEDKLCSQEAKGLNMLAEYYHIAYQTHVYASNRCAGTNSVEVSNQSNQSCVHIEVDIKQIQSLLCFLKNKLIQHTEAPTMIFAILRAIQTVTKRVRHYMSGCGDDEETQYTKNKLVKNNDLLGQELYELIYTKLAKYGDETAIGSQILEIRSQLLNDEIEELIQQMVQEKNQTN